MTQQVNLLNPALIRPRDWVSLKNVGVMYALVIVAMYVLYHFAQSDLDAMQVQRNAAVTKYEAAKLALITESSKKNRQMNVLEQEQELQSLMKKLDMQNKLVSTFKYVQSDNGHHVLDYMLGFARQVVPGVWVTGFKLHAFEKNITLSGRALQADHIPHFLEHLGQAAVFKGQLFSGLKLQSATLFDEVKGGAGVVSTPVPVPPTQAVAESQTTTANNPSNSTATPTAIPNAAVTPAKTVTGPRSVIEFEVKGYVPDTGDAISTANPSASAQPTGANNG